MITVTPFASIHILFWQRTQDTNYIIDPLHSTTKEIQQAFYVFRKSGLSAQ